MSKRLWISVGLFALALVGAVLFLVREVKEAPTSRPSSRPAEAERGSASARSSAPEPSDDQGGRDRPLRRPERLPKSAAPIPEDGVIKTTDDGREYVEYRRADGTRVRDFRASAKKRLEHSRPSQGPRLLEPQNAARVKRDARPKVWACMREHWDALTALPGVDPENPVVVVFAKTSADESQAQLVSVEVVVEGAERGDPDLARCIEGALAGLSVGLASGVGQKAYEDFELGMRFYMPRQARKTEAP